MKQRKTGFGASPGGAKLYVLVALTLAGGIFVAAKIGPIYQQKWELEDKMEELMRRHHTLGEDGIFEGVQAYVDRNNMAFDVYEKCTFEGAPEAPGKMECNYEMPLGIPKFEKIKLRAYVFVPKIPVFSN